MNRGEAWFMHASTALIAVTGLVYAWMRYFATPSDPYAIVNHPGQPTFQHLHVLFAPIWIFAVGFVFKSHVWTRLRSGGRVRRRSGLTLLCLSAPMAASGYLLQVSSEPFWTQVWTVLHVASSVAFVALYAAHLLTPKRVKPAEALVSASTEPASTEPGSSPHTSADEAGELLGFRGSVRRRTWFRTGGFRTSARTSVPPHGRPARGREFPVPRATFPGTPSGMVRSS